MRDIVMRKISLIGHKFGRLVVTSEQPGRKGGDIMWMCLCDCGNQTSVVGRSLREGNTKSCGCFQRERASKVNKKHGMRHFKEYGIWYMMLARCTKPDNKGFPNYGGRGIKVCERWQQFEAFYEDMGVCPDGYSIERVDNDGDYTPENCTWADRFTQSKNKRMNKNNTSGVVGVHPGSRTAIGKWGAEIMRNRVKHKLGYFEKLEDAIAARKEAEQRLDFAPLGDNSIDGQSAQK